MPARVSRYWTKVIDHEDDAAGRRHRRGVAELEAAERDVVDVELQHLVTRRPARRAVVTATVSNTWNEPMTVMIRTSARIGRSSGTVMLPEHPPLARAVDPAGLVHVSGMVCSPAKISSAV